MPNGRRERSLRDLSLLPLEKRRDALWHSESTSPTGRSFLRLPQSFQEGTRTKREWSGMSHQRGEQIGPQANLLSDPSRWGGEKRKKKEKDTSTRIVAESHRPVNFNWLMGQNQFSRFPGIWWFLNFSISSSSSHLPVISIFPKYYDSGIWHEQYNSRHKLLDHTILDRRSRIVGFLI